MVLLLGFRTLWFLMKNLFKCFVFLLSCSLFLQNLLNVHVEV